MKEGRERYYVERRLAKAKEEMEKRTAIMNEVEKSLNNKQKGGKGGKPGVKSKDGKSPKGKVGRGKQPAYLDGQWYTFDPRNNMPRIGRVLMARGRDACDVALTTAFGLNTLRRFEVWADEVGLS